MAVPTAYLDECVDILLADRLEQHGFAATSAQTQGMLAATDAEHLAYAAQRGWLLLTHNKLDFQRLHREYLRLGQAHGGLLIVPLCPLPRLELRMAMMLDWWAIQPEPPPRLLLWNDLQTQLNQGYRLPGYFESEVRFAVGR